MTQWFTAWQTAADVWLAWVVQRSCAGALAAVVVIAVVAVLTLPALRASAHLPSRLLLVPLLLFVLPVERLLPERLALPVPGVPAVADGLAAAALPPPPPRTRSGATATVAGYDDAPAATAAANARGLRAHDVAFVLWCAGTAFLLARLGRQQRRAQRLLVAAARPASTAVQAQFRALAHASGVSPRVRCAVVPGLASPLVAGCVRPVVYLPAELLATLPPAQLAFALRHELAHVQRHDAAVAAGAALVRTLFWFHPLAWLVVALLQRATELACDEAALARTTTRRSDAAAALLHVATSGAHALAPVGLHPPLLSSRSLMRTRILRLLDPLRATHRRMPPRALAAFAAVALGALAAARPQDPATATTPATGPAAANGEAEFAWRQGAAWLLAQQQADGSWAIGPDPAEKNQRDHNEVCVTAMAVRALLPGLRTEKLKIAQAVQRADAFLQASQAADGRFGPGDTWTMHYAHGNTLRALAAVQQEWPDEARRACIERGVAYALAVRNPFTGWRYGVRDADNDSKITAVMLLGLHAAKSVGVEVDPRALTEATGLLDMLTNGAGRTGFLTRGGVMSRFTSKQARFPGELSEEPTALRVLVHAAAGGDLAANESVQRSLAVVASVQPAWDVAKGSIDLAYWEFGAAAMAHAGDDARTAWRQRLQAALVPNRIVTGDTAHWPAIDAWSHPGMEAYTTASALLALRALR